MTRIVEDVLIIETEDNSKCELCGNISELRPYGPNNEYICFECGMKDEETTKKKFAEVLKSINKVIVV